MSIVINDIKRKPKPKSKTKESWDIKTPIFFRKDKVTEKNKARFYSDLHLLFSSGLDMNSVFNILIDQTVKENFKAKFRYVYEAIIGGEDLATALKRNQLAGDYEYYAIRIGEESGKLAEVLSEIKKYYERRLKQKRQITSALTYPVLVVFTALLAVGFMLNVIVPMFEEVFQRFQGELPALTQSIIDLSDWMKQRGWILILGFCIAAWIVDIISRKSWHRKYTHKLMSKIPVFGPLRTTIETARFCHIMALLTSAHSPLVQSIQMVSSVITFYPLKTALTKSAELITQGNSFNHSLEETRFFDRKFTALIKAAEEVNQLNYAFEKLNQQYNDQIDHKLSIIGSLMEPFLIIFVGGIVAVILISMYLPLFQIGTSIY